MKRQALQGGGWFDVDRATKFPDGSFHDGRNFISIATGSQWEHEAVYQTASGAWVLRAWSDWKGTSETWSRIDSADAAEWLIRNERELPACLVALSAQAQAEV